MKLDYYNTDRERDPLMKDLHELGLKHGAMFVLVAIPLDGKGNVHTFHIDHQDDTKPEESAEVFELVGMHFIKASEAIWDHLREQRRRENEP